MEKKKIYFAAFKGKSFISKVIKFFTRSEYSHIAVYLPDDNKLIEAWVSKNNRFNIKWIYSDFENHSKGTICDIYSLEVSEEEYRRAMDFYHYLAKRKFPYNYLGVIGFVLPFFTSNGGFFCSEGAWEGLVMANIKKYGFMEGWKVSPDLFVKLILSLGGTLEKEIITEK